MNGPTCVKCTPVLPSMWDVLYIILCRKQACACSSPSFMSLNTLNLKIQGFTHKIIIQRLRCCVVLYLAQPKHNWLFFTGKLATLSNFYSSAAILFPAIMVVVKITMCSTHKNFTRLFKAQFNTIHRSLSLGLMGYE